MDFSIGDKVLFGRPGGEHTLGEVVGVTRSGKLKIQQLEARGRSGQHAEGQVWTVPVEFVTPAGEQALSPAQAAAAEVQVSPLEPRGLVLAIDEWPGVTGWSSAGPVLFVSEPAWEHMLAGKVGMQQVLMRDPKGKPLFYLIVQLMPEGLPPRSISTPLLPAHRVTIQRLAESTHVDVQFVHWDPRRGWMKSFFKRISFNPEFARTAAEEAVSWAQQHDLETDTDITIARYRSTPVHQSYIEGLQPHLAERETRAAACEALLLTYIPDGVLRAIEVLPRLTWEESIYLGPALSAVAHWYVDSLLEQLPNCERKGPAALIRSVLALTRHPEIADDALDDEDLLVELGHEVFPLCVLPEHLPRVLELTRSSQRGFRSLGALSLAVMHFFTVNTEQQRVVMTGRLQEMAEGDRSKAVRDECSALLAMTPEEIWEAVAPKPLVPLG